MSLLKGSGRLGGRDLECHLQQNEEKQIRFVGGIKKFWVVSGVTICLVGPFFCSNISLRFWSLYRLAVTPPIEQWILLAASCTLLTARTAFNEDQGKSWKCADRFYHCDGKKREL